MKAIRYHEYGGPEVLQLEESAKPAPKVDQVLVQVRAAALNPYDMHFLHGTPYFMRLIAGLRKPKFTGIAVDFSGVVESWKERQWVQAWRRGLRRRPGRARRISPNRVEYEVDADYDDTYRRHESAPEEQRIPSQSRTI